MDLSHEVPDLRGWTPIRVGWSDEDPLVDWCHTEGIFFTDPFFGETVERCFGHPFRLLFRHQTTIEEVGRFVAEHPGVPPAGFIFHLSRCGSTLVSQILAAVPEHLVLSEPAPVDSVLRVHQVRRDLSEDARIRWLRWIISALGQPRRGERKLFVKFDAWSAGELPLVRRAFPDVPWLFLFRDPVEILVSHSGRFGAHMIPGVLPANTVAGVPPGSGVSLAEYGAQVLAGICEAVLAHQDDPLGTFVDYSQLPAFVIEDLLNRWGVGVAEADIEHMRQAATRNAKNPALVFEDDQSGKQAAATPELRRAAQRWLAPLYDRLRQAAREPFHAQ